jgi:hypothetical protein
MLAGSISSAFLFLLRTNTIRALVTIPREIECKTILTSPLRTNFVALHVLIVLHKLVPRTTTGWLAIVIY